MWTTTGGGTVCPRTRALPRGLSDGRQGRGRGRRGARGDSGGKVGGDGERGREDGCQRVCLLLLLLLLLMLLLVLLGRPHARVLWREHDDAAVWCCCGARVCVCVAMRSRRPPASRCLGRDGKGRSGKQRAFKGAG